MFDAGLCWAVFYYLFTFRLCANWIRRTKSETLYSYLVPSLDGSGPVAALCRVGGGRYSQVMFLVAFGILYCLCSLLAIACWHSYLLHTAVVIIQCSSSLWDGIVRYRAMAANGWAEVAGFAASSLGSASGSPAATAADANAKQQ